MNITLHMMDKNDIELARHLAPREELVKLTLAKHRGLLAIDTDDMVVKNCGMKITDIFLKYGEKYFRRKH